MRKLDELIEGPRVVIPCFYNGGRKATVRATVGHPEIIHISIEDRAYYGCYPFSYLTDGYLHIDTEQIDKDLSASPEDFVVGYRRKEAEAQVGMICEINKHFFAGTLTVLSDDKMISERSIRRPRTLSMVFEDVKKEWINYGAWDAFDFFTDQPRKTTIRSLYHRFRAALSKMKKQYERIEVIAPLSDAHLGGSWQHYYDNNNWLKESEAFKGGQIYLA